LFLSDRRWRPVRNGAHPKGAMAMWWLTAVSLLALGILIYVTSALHVLSFSPLVTGRQAAERDNAVREALEKAETPASAGNSRAAPTIQLQAGAESDAARFDVPVPFDARMPNARTREGQSATPSRDRALLATSGEVADVLAFYRDELASHGWHEVRTWMSRPANGVPGPGGAVSAFCREADRPALLVGVVSREAGLSELRLLIDAEQPGPCASSSEQDPWNGRPPPVF
jgi:hypothetical protein